MKYLPECVQHLVNLFKLGKKYNLHLDVMALLNIEINTFQVGPRTGDGFAKHINCDVISFHS